MRTSKYVFALLAISAVLLVYTMASTSVVWIEPTTFGLAGKLPFAYWIGLAFLGSLWYLGRKSKLYLAASFVLTLLYLYVAPAVIRVPVWISNSYYPFGESKLLNAIGHIDYRPATTLVSYLDWPGFLYFASQFTLVTGIPDYFLLKYFPLLVVTLYGVFLILIQRNKLGSSLAIFSGAFLLAGFFIRQQYFGPQAISYVLFLMGILVISWLFFDDRAHKRTLTVLLLLLFVATTFMHPLTSLMLLVTMASVYITYRLFLKKASGTVLIMCFIFGIVWLAYQPTFASGFFNVMIRHLRDLVLGVRKPNVLSTSSRVIGSRYMELNFLTSYAIVGLFAGVALLSILLIFRRIRKQKMFFAKDQEYSIFSVVLLVMLAVFAFAGEYGEAEAYQRAFFFGLVPLTFLCVSLLRNKPKLLVVFLVAVVFLNIPAQYGSDTYRLATDSQLRGTQFLTFHTPESFFIIGRLTLYIRYYDPLKNYTIPDIGLDYPFTSMPNSSAVNEAIDRVLGRVNYVTRSALEDNFYVFSLGFNPFESIDFNAKCNLVYDNGQFTLYSPRNST
jgi:hypothetical protein